MSIRRQCELLGLNRSTDSLPPASASAEDLRLMRWIDQESLRTPIFGSRRMVACLECAGETVNRERVQRPMAVMGLDASHPKPRTPTPASDARVDR